MKETGVVDLKARQSPNAKNSCGLSGLLNLRHLVAEMYLKKYHDFGFRGGFTVGNSFTGNGASVI